MDAARVVESKAPLDVPDPIEWRFDEPQSEWKVLDHFKPDLPPPQIEQSENALRVSLSETHRDARRDRLHGDIYVALPDLTRADWSHVLVRARASEKIRNIAIGFNLRAEGDTADIPWWRDGSFAFWGDRAPVVNDGSVQTYRVRADWSPRWLGEWEDPWRELGFSINAGAPSSFDILSVTIVPKAALYADKPVAVRTETRSHAQRRALYTHVPGRIEYRVRVPEAARLDVGLGVLRGDIPVDFRVTATPEGGETETLLEETYTDREHWAQRSVDLSAVAGRTVSLTLEAEAEKPGAVAFWAAPTLSHARTAEKPNVIFYVLDGGGADYMSVYGYNRRTTPNLERLGAEGAVFEYAYSNSSWSKPSTTSFMTSLQNSVLGNTRGRFDPLPEEAVTMAEHMHRAGYQTAVFTSNAWAGSMSSLDRGVDVMRDAGAENETTSSVELHQDFWNWRNEYPGTPYWVHFQTTDVHAEGEDANPVAPFAGLFLSPEQEKTWREWDKRLSETGDHGVYSESYEKTGLSRVDFFSLQQRMYDQNMAHNDYQLGRLVERLKAEGEWENTLLIIGADHSTWAAMDDMGIAIQDSLPPRWSSPIFRPSISRVPLIFVWPRHIAGGQRFSEPVSMIDVLPTMLDFVGLPPAEAMQGQSLASLLLGKKGWEPRPVIFDEFSLDSATGELHGTIEVVDGRWGASLWIGPEHEEEERRRPTPLLLYDLWTDPYCLSPVNEDRPDLVEKYTAFLEAQWEAHQALAQHFTAGGDVALTPEQLETLRSLGYIQ
ncbi:sulfatase [Acidobacteria bacterium AH-259-O06]|nr:sulfatase [Acidobacteria bacterium AH-259-O06]